MIVGKVKLRSCNGRRPTSALATAARFGITSWFYSLTRRRRYLKSAALAWARSSWRVATSLCAGLGLVLVLWPSSGPLPLSSTAFLTPPSSETSNDPLGGVVAALVVINLARRADRWYRISQHLRSHHHHQVLHGLKIERIEAVDGHNSSQVDFAQMVVDGRLRQRAFESVMHKKRRVWGQEMTVGACGCFLSHMRAWERALHLNASVLVLEDDVELVSPLFERIFPRALQDLPKNFGLLYLGDMAKDGLTIRKTRYSATLLRLSRPLWGTFAYVVSPQAARRLLFHALPIDVQVDSYIKQVAELYEKNMPNFVVAEDVVYTDNSESRDTDAQQKHVAINGGRDEDRESKKMRPQRYHVLSSQTGTHAALRFDPSSPAPHVMYHDVRESGARFASVLRNFRNDLDELSSDNRALRTKLQRWLLCLLVAAHNGGGLCFTEPFVVLRSIDHLLQDVQVGIFMASSSLLGGVGERSLPPPPIVHSPSDVVEPLLSVLYAGSLSLRSPAQIARKALSRIARLMKTTGNVSSTHLAQTMANDDDDGDASTTVATFPPHLFDPLVPLQRPCRCERGWAAVTVARGDEEEEDAHLAACQSRCDRGVAPPYAAGYRVLYKAAGVEIAHASLLHVKTLHVVVLPSTDRPTLKRRLRNIGRWRRLHPSPTWRIVVHDGNHDETLLRLSQNLSRAGHPTSTITSIVSACVGLDAVNMHGGVYVDISQTPRRALLPGILSPLWSENHERQQIVNGRCGPAVALFKKSDSEQHGQDSTTTAPTSSMLGSITADHIKQQLSPSFFAAPAPNHPVIRRLSVACWRAANLLPNDPGVNMIGGPHLRASLLQMQHALMDDAWSVRFHGEGEVFAIY